MIIYINLHITNVVSGKEFCTLNLMTSNSVKRVKMKDPYKLNI